MRSATPFLDYHARMMKAQTEAGLFDVLTHAIGTHGFDRVGFHLLTDHRDIGKKAGIGLMRQGGEDLSRYYFKHGFDKIDPLHKRAWSEDGVYSWKEVSPHITLTRKQAELINFLDEAGMRDRLFIPLRGPGGQMAGVGIAAFEDNDHSRVDIDLIQAYCQHFYIAYKKLHRKEAAAVSPPELTVKERDILSLAAAGKSDAEIGETLRISKYTVNSHFRNIFKKLDTNNRVHAVSKALLTGQIQP